MMLKRAPATFVAALLAFSSACVPVQPTRSTPTPTPAPVPEPAPAPAPATADPSVAVREPELLGEDLAMLETEVRAASRDILGTVSYDLPMVANSWVEAELDFLVEERREVIARWLARGDYYQGFVKEVLRAQGVPTDLYHLAMIESGFVPTARSRVGATGFWQFMPATARQAGLRLDSLVDERMDPVRSTRAAARHLRSLHRELGDWSLAAAAYNAGSGRITRGMRSFAATDFWDLAARGDLAAETKQYVPRLYAMTVIGRDPQRFGFSAAGSSAFAFDSIQIEYATPFDELAKLGDVTIEQLTQLNPHLMRQTTPPGAYWVWVPAAKGAALQRAWLASEFRKEQGHGTYTVRPGDTLSDLAELSGLRASRIRELNPSVDFDKLQIGEKLRLPYRTAQQLTARPARSEPSGESRVAAREPERRPSEEARAVTHTVESGETLWEIARKYGLSIEELQTANDLDDSTIRLGQELRIPGAAKTGGSNPAAKAPETTEHVVRSGESLWAIARQYGSTVTAIQDANQLGDRPIRPGQKLTIPVLN